MKQFNPKGVIFWGCLFCVAGCIAFGLGHGIVAFSLLAVLIALLA